MEVVDKLRDEYQRDYCKGIVFERLGKVALTRTTPRAKYVAYEHLRDAMEWYEKAEKSHPEKEGESIIRWNACVRMINKFNLKPPPEQPDIEPLLDT